MPVAGVRLREGPLDRLRREAVLHHQVVRDVIRVIVINKLKARHRPVNGEGDRRQRDGTDELGSFIGHLMLETKGTPRKSAICPAICKASALNQRGTPINRGEPCVFSFTYITKALHAPRPFSNVTELGWIKRMIRVWI